MAEDDDNEEDEDEEDEEDDDEDDGGEGPSRLASAALRSLRGRKHTKPSRRSVWPRKSSPTSRTTSGTARRPPRNLSSTSTNAS